MARIVRTQRTADHFTIIANAAVRDSRLSWKARGMLAWLLSHQEGWETSVKDMAKHATDGKGSVETGLQELEACGYLERRQVRDGAGKMGATEYHVTDEYEPTPRPENQVTDTATRFSVTGSAGTGSSDPKKTIPQKTNDQNTSSDARSASTANPVDPPQQQQAYVPRERDDAAAADSMDHTPTLAGRDAPRAANDPAAILDAAMLNPHEADQFRTWLRDRTGATNPDGLVIQLHRSSDLSARIIQWRSDSPTQPPTGVQTPPPARTAWCGLCDRSTRLTVTHDEHGHELVRRCPDCHPASGHTPPGAGAAARLAQDAQLVAANNTGAGRAAYQAARAKLPTGARRRVTTHLDQEADPS